MHTINELSTIINKALDTIDIFGEPKKLYQPIEYTLEFGGKRLRPVLMMLTCEMYKGKIEESINPALGIEIFHNFTLLHDDIMDQAPIRRGRETVYKKWNTNTAILSGDTMFAMAYDYVRQTRPEIVPEIMKTFCQTSIEVCEGQQYDMNFETATETSIADYLNMIRLKTAVALAASMQIGAAIAGATKSEQSNLYHFGELLGMAFQLQDDYFDAFGDEAKFGKKIGGDIIARKKTYLYLKALEIADSETAKNLELLYMGESKDPDEKIKKVKDILSSLKIQQYTQDLINKYFDDAMEIFQTLSPDAEHKEMLKTFALLILNRDK